jgi:murein DD-endopeptidase MepM/ murein hydrolase activator NlpD
MVRQAATAACAALMACACTAPPQAPRRPRADVRLRAETETIEARVPRGATLDSVFRTHLAAELVSTAVQSAAAAFNPRQLRAGRPYRIVRTLDGLLREFEYQIDTDRFLHIVRRDRAQPHVLDAEVVPYQKHSVVVTISGRVSADHPSLITAVEGAGEHIQLAMALAEIFAGQIDFESDLQPGDAFDVLVERSTRDGEFASYGPVLAARLAADGREQHAFRWAGGGSSAGYYDENGRSLKRFFLRTPLRFEPRVTSDFSRRRLHPVHRTYRAHLGVDYGAPQGAAVVSVAGGVVVSAGWAGGGGRQVRIRHARGFESYYLHLSAFGKGIRAGARVEQGQIIGRVGSTGTATGAHLDYRLKKAGVFVNPLVEHRRLPPGVPISTTHLASFRTARDGMLQKLSTAATDAPPQKPDVVKAVR